VVETNPLQVAVSGLLAFSAIIIMISAYQASTETVPEIELFKETVVLRGRKVRLAEALVNLVDERIRGPKRLLLALSLRHAKEYLSYGAWTAAAYEASRAYEMFKRLSRTTSSATSS
jgi:hypothetical protein